MMQQIYERELDNRGLDGHGVGPRSEQDYSSFTFNKTPKK